jgi:hypothetical protein
MHPRVQGRQRLSENLERITEGAVLDPRPRPLLRRRVVAGARRRAGRGLGAGRPRLSFDLDSGQLRAEAGVTLMRLNRLSLPRGWFTPVTPGTHWVTLGGMVAARRARQEPSCRGHRSASTSARCACASPMAA